MTQRKLISVITPCFNEEESIADCYEAVKKVFQTSVPNYDYEHVFCDNASSDKTVDILKGIAAGDKNVKIIVNARNYGTFRSVYNAMMQTKGDGVLVLLPVDLQDPPEMIPQFIQKWEAGYQIVYGLKAKREENFLMDGARRFYYALVERFADIHIPPNVGEFQFIDRVVVEALRKFDDYYPYIRGMIACCGFKACGIEYVWRARKKGFSKNRLISLVDQGLNGLVSFTKVPLRACMCIGFALSAISICYAIFSVAYTLITFHRFVEAGIPTLITAIFFFSGVQLFFLGVLGEYIGAIHFQVRKRPLVIEKERVNI